MAGCRSGRGRYVTSVYRRQSVDRILLGPFSFNIGLRSRRIFGHLLIGIYYSALILLFGLNSPRYTHLTIVHEWKPTEPLPRTRHPPLCSLPRARYGLAEGDRTQVQQALRINGSPDALDL